MRISDWSSDVCSSDLGGDHADDIVPVEGSKHAFHHGFGLVLRAEHADGVGIAHRPRFLYVADDRFGGEVVALLTHRHDATEISHDGERVGLEQLHVGTLARGAGADRPSTSMQYQ